MAFSCLMGWPPGFRRASLTGLVACWKGRRLCSVGTVYWSTCIWSLQHSRFKVVRFPRDILGLLEAVPKNEVRCSMVILTWPWKSCSITSTASYWQQVSHRANSDSRERDKNYTGAYIPLRWGWGHLWGKAPQLLSVLG